MPAFKTEVPHSLEKDQAIEKLKGFVESASERFKGQVSEFEGDWADSTYTFRLKTYGFSITGTMTVDDSVVRMEGTIPFAAMPFKGKIEKSFAAELGKVLR
jgi:hypothetical protein